MLAQSMGREGEWSASSQSPGSAPQFSAYGAPYGAPPGQQQQQQYPPGAAAPMQPPGSGGSMMRGGGGAMPVQYGSAPPSSAGGGLAGGSYGSGSPGLQPQWQGSQGMQQPPAASGGHVFRSAGGGPPPNAGPPGTGSTGNHRSYGGPPPPGAPQFRPPSNSPLNVAARGPTGPPPGPFGAPPGAYGPGSGPVNFNRPIFSQPQSTPPLFQQPARLSQAPSTNAPPGAPTGFAELQKGPPPPSVFGQVPGSNSQMPGQGPRPPMGQPEPLYRNPNAAQSTNMGTPPNMQGLQQQMQGMSIGQPGQNPSGPPSYSAPGQPHMAPPTWQAPQRRVYPDAYTGQSPNASMPPMPGAPQQFHPGNHHMPGGMAPGMQTMSQPGSPAGGQPGSASRIDPNQIPRPQPTITSVNFDTRVNGQATLPPSATTNFIVRDTGNCSPRMMRCTLNQIPCSGDLLSNSGMPLAIMVQPLAVPHPSEEHIQIVDFGESGPVRCAAPHCKAYINPFMKFIDQGRRFVCNLCGHTSETPRDYHCNLGPDGRRRDADARPELARGTVEFVAPKEYQVRPPMPHVFFFLVDVSMTAVSTGSVAAACSAINRALADIGENPQTLVGIATFDSTIHFYNMNRSLQMPSMLVVPDVQDVYTPRQNDLLVPLIEGREHLEQILETIPSMFQNNRIAESAFGAAVKGAYLALKPTGGKLLVFQSVLPSVGFGALTAREGEGKVNEKEAQKLMQPADKTLKTMALELAEFQVCVDLFLTSQNYVDIASLAVIPRSTGGQIYYYHSFQANVDSAKLYNDLRWNVTRPQGLEAVMRVRCSNGLQVQDYFGNFCKRNPTDVDLPAIDCDKTIMVTFKHDDKFQDNADCCFQSALLYTTTNGQRRIRINTLSLSCTTGLSHLFRGADLDAQFTYFLKQAAQDVPNTPVVQLRDRMTGQCVTILYTYRKFCATASSAGQLILPEALKLLPLYTMALTKSVGLRTDVRIDERSYWLSRVASLSASLAIPLVYPRMFAIHNLQFKDELGGAILPPVVPLSSENLDHDGIFLLETGEDAFLYLAKQASPEVLYKLFGVRSVDEVATGQVWMHGQPSTGYTLQVLFGIHTPDMRTAVKFHLQEYDNEMSKRLNEVVNEIRRQRSSYLRLRLMKRGDPQELLFLSYLVEDKTALGLSYVEFLVHVHRLIQNRMT